MSNSNHLILVDGNNLAIRAAFACDLSMLKEEAGEEVHPDETFAARYTVSTGMLHGFFKGLAALRRAQPEHYLAVIWDGGASRRVAWSEEAVRQGIVPQPYKGNRKTDAVPEPISLFRRQKPILQQALSCTNIPQVQMHSQEADDVIASYVARYRPCCDDLIVASSDKDFFQLLGPPVRVRREDGFFTELDFASLHALRPRQWIDVGALMGDDSDNIFGVPGWGVVTASNAIRQAGTVERWLEECHCRMDPLRDTHVDLPLAHLSRISDLKTDSGRLKYPAVFRAEYSGVALALEQKKIRQPKAMIVALMFEPRIHLAKRLKTMYEDLAVRDLPGWASAPLWDRRRQADFLRFCAKYRLREIAAEADRLCRRQTM
jgi:5'-3' exonuclease